MAFFIYTGRDQAGRRVRGRVEADAAGQAVEALRGRGIFITSLEADRDVGAAVRRRLAVRRAGRRPRAGELAALCRQLGALLEAGVPLLQALAAAREQAVSPALAEALGDAAAAVGEGRRLGEAFAAQPVFPPLMAQVLGAAEVGGFLDAALRRLAEHFERERDLAARVAAATLYPKMVALAAAGLLGLLTFFVLPRFGDLFEQMDVELPSVLRLALGIREVLLSGTGLAAAAATAGALALAWWSAACRAAARAAVGALMERLPLLGRLRLDLEMARFFRTLGTLLDGGVPLLGALDVWQAGIAHRRLRELAAAIRRSVEEGHGLLEPVRRAGLLGPAGVALLATGEETGSVPAMLLRLADAQEQEARELLDRFTGYLEPVIIVVVGIVVAVLLASVFNPIFSVYGRL